jgi:error-prone DNA polymerase
MTNCTTRYFLTVYDIVRFARSRAFVPGRFRSKFGDLLLPRDHRGGSGASTFCSSASSRRAQGAADIDVDFEHERREEVIQYIYEKYGATIITATVIRYRGRSANEVGKAFGLSDDTVGHLSGMLWGWSQSGVKEQEARRAGLDPSDPRLSRVMQLAEELIDTPRHLSQHVGGFLMTQTPLEQLVPIENAAMEDRTVIEWDKDDLNELGILKVDVLGLGMLSCLRRGLDLMRIHYKLTPTIPSLLEREHKKEKEREAVYRDPARADT